MQQEDVPRPACKGSSKTCTPPWSQDTVGPSRCDGPMPFQALYPQQQGLNLAPTGALCPGRVKGIGKTTLRDCLGTWWLFPTIMGTVPSPSAPSLVHQRFSAKSPKRRQVAEPSSLPHATAYEGQSSSFQSFLHALHGHVHQPHPRLTGKLLQRGGYNSCINSPSSTPLMSP